MNEEQKGKINDALVVMDKEKKKMEPQEIDLMATLSSERKELEYTITLVEKLQENEQPIKTMIPKMNADDVLVILEKYQNKLTVLVNKLQSENSKSRENTIDPNRKTDIKEIMRKPTPFSSGTENFVNCALSMSEYLEAVTTDNQERILVVGSFLKNEAKEWHHMYLALTDKTNEWDNHEFPEFSIYWHALVKEFGDERYHLNAARNLQTLKMRGTLEAYHSEFRKLAQRVDAPASLVLQWYTEVLQEDIAARLICNKNADFSLAMTDATKIYPVLERNKGKSSSKINSGTYQRIPEENAQY
jgi:Retrotransposon gag protein